MQFFSSAIDTLQTLVVALGAGLGVWGVVNLLEGYGSDNPGSKSQGMKQVIVVVFQINAGTAGQRIPAIRFRDVLIGAGLIRHLQKQNIGQLRHILVVGDAVVPQYIAESAKYQ